MRLMMTVEYDGTGFNGWQLQPDGRTVQGALEEAIARATGTHSRVTGAGRTDSGVHALGQVAHFDTDSRLPADQLLKAVNFHLPKDVALLDCRAAPDDFHARFGTSSKLYRYRILRSAVRRPMRDRFCVRIRHPHNAGVMRECAALLEGEHDFTSFASEHTGAAGKVRRVLRSELIEDGDELHYMVEATGFLYNMVRIIVGTLLMAGRGRYTPGDVAAMLEARDRKSAGPTAPPRGLTLMEVRYPNDPREDDCGGAAC